MKYLRRLMTYLATRLVLLTLCAALLVCAFYLAYNMGSAYILVTEGMEKRVDVCLTREDYTTLNKYFTVDFLNHDIVLSASASASSPYLPYNISSFEYDLKVGSLRTWPWSNVVQCTVTESVTDITGTVKASYAQEVSSTPPTWASGRYSVSLTRQADGSWKISSLVQDPNYKDAGR